MKSRSHDALAAKGLLVHGVRKDNFDLRSYEYIF